MIHVLYIRECLFFSIDFPFTLVFMRTHTAAIFANYAQLSWHASDDKRQCDLYSSPGHLLSIGVNG